MLKVNVTKYISFMESTLQRHLLFWFLIMLYFAAFNRMDCTESSVVVFAFLFSLSFIFSYYFLFFIVFPFAIKKHYPLVIIGYLIAFCIFIGIDLINFNFIFPLVKIKTQRDLSDFPNFIRISSFWFAFLLIVSYANMISIVRLNNIKIINQKISLGLERELNILKHQFHSHLNYNFLNFCYSGLLKVSREKAEIIDHYSNMLSYSLNLNQKDKIPIRAEIEYIQHFMAIQSQLNNHLKHELNFLTDNESFEITPLLLGFITETVYKYSSLTDLLKSIEITIIVAKNKLNYAATYKNKKNQTFNIDPDVINHLKQFLELKHCGRYQLDINELEETTRINLVIDDSKIEAIV
jgi:two-component system, LytTR family, sensor kinase